MTTSEHSRKQIRWEMSEGTWSKDHEVIEVLDDFDRARELLAAALKTAENSLHPAQLAPPFNAEMRKFLEETK